MLCDQISELIMERVLTDDEMEEIVNECNEIMDTLCESTSKESFTYISGHIITMIDEMIKDCLDTECYESCSNIKRFYDGFYRTT